MNDQEIKRLVEKLEASSLYLSMIGKVGHGDRCEEAANVIEHLQSELRAKDERIKNLEEEVYLYESGRKIKDKVVYQCLKEKGWVK